MVKEQIATLKKFSTNPATQDPVHLSVCWTDRSSVLETHGYQENVNSGEIKEDKLSG